MSYRLTVDYGKGITTDHEYQTQKDAFLAGQRYLNEYNVLAVYIIKITQEGNNV